LNNPCTANIAAFFRIIGITGNFCLKVHVFNLFFQNICRQSADQNITLSVGCFQPDLASGWILAMQSTSACIHRQRMQDVPLQEHTNEKE